jgi:hypothetical protein
MPLYQLPTWTTWTPTLSSATGTLGTYTINVARYVREGSKITMYVYVAITSAGSSPGGNLRITLPVAGKAGVCGAGSGEDTNTGNVVTGRCDGTAGYWYLHFNSGATATGNNTSICASAIYEAA